MANISDNNVILRLILKSKEYQKDLKKSTTSTDNLKKSITSLKRILGGAIAFKITRDIAALAIQSEKTKVSFEAFLGSARKAEKVLKDLNKFSLKTPFTPEEVNQAGKALLAFGISQNKLIPSLEAIGDLSAGTGKNFNELAVIYGKARVQGTLFAEDINQLTEAGIPILEEFGKQLGVSAGEVKKLGSQGKISFSNLEEAFISLTSEGGKFYNLTINQSKTLGGVLSTVQGAFSGLLKNIGLKFLPAAKNVGLAIGVMVDKFNEFISIPVEKKIKNEQEELNLLVTNITDANIKQEDRNKLINELQKEYPAFLTNLDSEKVTNEELSKRLSDVNNQYILKIALQAEDEKLQEKSNEVAINSRRLAEQRTKANEVANKLNSKYNLGLDLTNKTLQERVDLVKQAIDSNDDIRINSATRAQLNLSTSREKNNSILKDELNILQQRRKEIEENIKSQLGIGDTDFIDGGNKENEIIKKNEKINEKERKKIREKKEKDEKEALQNIIDLKNAAIIDDEQRQIEQARTAAERTIAGLVGSEKQIEEQAKLIRELLKREEKKIRESFQPFTAEDVETQLFEESIIKEEAEKLLEKMQVEIDKQEPLKLNIQTTSPEQLKKDTESINSAIDSAAPGFGEKVGKLFDPESENNKKLREGLSALQDITGSIFAADDKATEARLNNIDAQVKAADERIKRAVEGGKEGSEEVIAIEKAKIETLEKARQRSLEQQQKQAKIESALAATSSLVNAVPLVIDLFKKGGLVGGLAGIASVIASIATLKAAVQKNTPTFHDGTSYADETGTATGGKLKSNEFMAKLEKGEMVIPKGDSARLRHLGVKHTDILKLAESTRDKGVVTLGGNLDDSQQIIETNNRIISQNDKLLRYIKNLKTEVKIDERGLSIRQMRLQSKIKKRR